MFLNTHSCMQPQGAPITGGVRCRIFGMTKPELAIYNGLEATIVSWDSELSRWWVRPDPLSKKRRRGILLLEKKKAEKIGMMAVS